MPKTILNGTFILLQWGRGHVTAESNLGRFDIVDEYSLQWGRGHVTAESLN